MTNKQKILCLHGYRQNASKFSAQTGSLRKMFKNEVDFHYISAPHLIPKTQMLEGEDEDQRAWWFSKENSFSNRDETDTDKGLAESLVVIEKYFKENGPFQGILGFSQGAGLVGLLCGLKERKEIEMDFQFVIVISGFKSRCTLHAKYYEQKININSLHVIGETDETVTKEVSFALADLFVNPVIFTHPGGHFVPGRNVYKKNYVDFVTAQKNIQKPPD